MKRTWPERWLSVLIVAHLALGGLYAWATPILEAPDEGYHFSVVHWIAAGHGLPVQKIGQRADWEQEGSQPPLYYLLSAVLVAGVDMADWSSVYVRNPFIHHIPGAPHNINLFRHGAGEAWPWRGSVLAVYLTRLFSLALSAATLWLTYRIALRVFPGDVRLALIAVALVGFNPMVLFVNAAVNNDNLVMLLSTAILNVTLALMTERVQGFYWKAAGLGGLLGLAALTKISGLVLWPVAGLGVAWGAWRARDWRRVVGGGLLMAGLAGALCGWWFWRNWTLYGEWLGLATMAAIAGPRLPAASLWRVVSAEWVGFYLSYWGVFGVFTIRASGWVYAFYNLVTLAAAGGGLWALTHARRAVDRTHWPERLWLALFIFLTLAGVVNWTMQTLASQGRLLFGAIAPLSIFMALGLLAAAPRRLERWFMGGVCVSLALMAAVVPLVDIAPRYRRPPTLSAADLPADMRPVQARFDASIELIGYSVDEAARHPGGTQVVTLYWRALQPMPVDYALALHLLGQGAAEVGKIDTWPGGGLRPTSQWQPGEIFADRYVLPIAAEAAAPSRLRLNLYFWITGSEQRLTSYDAAGQALDSITVPVGRLTPAAAPGFQPQRGPLAKFEYGIELAGLDTRRVGQALALTLYWRASQRVPADYTVFLHVVDAHGVELVAVDGPPLNNDWPTSAWEAGQTFADQRLIRLPASLPPGCCALRLGWYDPVGGERLTAYGMDGSRLTDNTLVVDDLLGGLP